MSVPLILSLALGTASAAEPETATPSPEPAPTACDAAIVEANDRDLPADQLNALGMRCYKEKRYNDAGMLFFDALKRDENHALANYNLACVIGLLLQTQGPCDMEYSREAAPEYLRRAVAKDPKRAARARVDSDLDSLRSMMAFRLAVEGEPKTAQQTANLYDGATLWGDTPGVATMAEVRFARTHPTALSGTVSGWFLDRGTFEQVPASGTWRAEGPTIIVDWAARTSPEGTNPGSTETIRLDEMNRYGHGGWFTMPDWCSA